MTGDTPEAAAREVAERQIEKAIARARQKAATMRYSANYEHHCLLDELATELLSFRRAALEDAAKVAQGYPDTAQGEFHSSGATCWNVSQNIASAIRALAGSTKEGE